MTHLVQRALLLVAAVALGAGVLPAAAVEPDGFDCGPDDGREQLTLDGFTLAFDAPALFAPEIQDTREQTGPVVTTQRAAKFYFRANFVPYRAADLVIDLDWTHDNSDYDLFVFDEHGFELARSAGTKPDIDEIGERVNLRGLGHCKDIAIEVWNWVGPPDDTLTLDIAVTGAGPQFSCTADDPHPACAGKQAGAAPDRVEDSRIRLYLAGDRPGQVAMVPHYVYGTAGLGEPPAQGRLVPERPRSGQTNTFTHPPTGNDHQAKNPFQAHFTVEVPPDTRITGDLHAFFWVSSATLRDGGTLFVDLFADSFGPLEQTRVARVAIPGTQVQPHATLVRVTFTGLNLRLFHDLTLQISTLGVVTTGGDVHNPADAHWTVYYDSVQFPAFVTLNLPSA